MGLEEVNLTPIPGGYRVRETEHYYLDVMKMLLNWRLVTTYKDDSGWHRGWCYYGTGPQALANAVAAANAWDGSDDTEPDGWDKNLQTGEWKADRGKPWARHG
jgi:hypothetical protein